MRHQGPFSAQSEGHPDEEKGQVPVSSPAYWSSRYRLRETGWDLGGVTPALRWLLEGGRLPVRPPARVLVPGCGIGHDVMALAAYSYQVTALDWAPEALAALEAQAPSTVRVHCADFFGYAHEAQGTYEAIWEYTFYCAIEPHLRRTYFEGVARLLREGGYWVALLFPLGSQPYAEGPPFQVDEIEVQALAKAYGLVQAEIIAKVPSHPARAGREKLILLKKAI